jgi:L-alanine-DL-glutamate epimerase-like enolase superfamily enzyme
MQLSVRRLRLPLAETFTIARDSRDHEDVVVVALEHDGLVGYGEAAPVDYLGETAEAAAAFLTDEAPALLGDDPWRLEAIGARLARRSDVPAARCALDGALHDWIGKRAGQPVWRLLGLDPVMPPTSFTIGIDSVDATADRARRAAGRFRALKVKVGGAEDLGRLEAVRAAFAGPIRIDGNEGWTLATARALLPDLARLGVELIEQPFPRDDVESYRALREAPARPPVFVDEGCDTAVDVARVAPYVDGVNLKLAKAGGLREAHRAIAVARALGLRVMLGCMVESELGIAHAAQLASLVDVVDLDGHLLLASSPFRGLGLVDGRVTVSHAPGLGVEPAA